MVEKVCQRIMEAEIIEFLGAGPHELTDEKICYCNGYKPQILRTQFGELNLTIPKDREGNFSSKLFARYEKARNNAITSQGILIVMGIGTDSRHEVLSFDIADSESEASWSEVFANLRDRGLSGVKLIIHICPS